MVEEDSLNWQAAKRIKKQQCFVKFSKSFFFDFCVSKFTPSPIPIKTGFCVGVLQKDLHLVYKISTIEKTSSTYTHKNGVLRPLLRAMFTVCLQKAILKIVLSPNSHRNDESTPPIQFFLQQVAEENAQNISFQIKNL